MLGPVLDSKQERLIADERLWLGRLQTTLARLDVDRDDLDTLERSIRQLDQLFLLVVVGEFNAGKSALINALVGRSVLEEGVTPTTTKVQILTHGPEPGRSTVEPALDVVTAPVDLLKTINIVDTPGTNAIYRQHEAITADFVPRADLILFVTSADRPFTETERAFLEAIRSWGKKIVFVINKVDLLETPAEVEAVQTFVADSARSLLGIDPVLFGVSARRALRSRTSPTASGSDPGVAALERFIHDTLDQRERIRLKVLNPLGVGLKLIEQNLAIVDGRLDLLKQDASTVQDIESADDLYQEDLRREFGFRLSHVENVLHEFEKRGIHFFDDTLRIGRLFDLMNKNRLKIEFEREVVADLPQVIERQVHEMIDWMVASELRHWQGVTDRVQRRRAAHAERLVGSVGGTFTYDRARLLDTVGRAAQRAVEGFDRDAEATKMAESVRMAVAGAALAEAGAISLGAAVTALASTTFADVTGMLAAGAIAVIGLFVIPVRRRRAKHDLRAQISTLRERLMGSLTGQFEREVTQSVSRIREAVAPYSRFVRTERERLSGSADDLRGIQTALTTIRSAAGN
jgi:small GTP-binding protein